MKLSIYSKIGIGLIVLATISFVLALSMFTYRGEVSPFIRKFAEITLVIWTPVFFIGGFILVFRLIRRLLTTEDKYFACLYQRSREIAGFEWFRLYFHELILS
jgi:hypothetical protein